MLIDAMYVRADNTTEIIQIEEPAEPEITIEDRITTLKSNLSSTDYLAIKYAEGLLLETEYAPIKAQRQAWRDEINELEAQLN